MLFNYDAKAGFRTFYDVYADRFWFLMAVIAGLVAAGEIAVAFAELPVVPGSFSI